MTLEDDSVAVSNATMREAAVWMTLLHGPDRSARMEAGFRRWLAANRSHSVAFEAVATAWEATEGLRASELPRLGRSRRARVRTRFAYAMAMMAMLTVVGLLGWVIYLHAIGIETEVGEQRMLTLDDGSRVHLNTDTLLVVDYEPGHRRVELKQGEAYFEVAKDSKRPFIVSAGDRLVTALGTSFAVRNSDAQLSITLVEGQVVVSADSANKVGGASPSSPPESQAGSIVLTPGERLTFGSREQLRLDRPVMDRVTAWRVGRVYFDDTSLADAAAEMNRYNRMQIHVESPRAAALQITGVFRTGDSESFANVVARSYGLQVTTTRQTIALSGEPSRSSTPSL